MRHHTLALAVFCACLTLAASHHNKAAPALQQTGENSLPQPNAAGGSVTGMPNPGTPSVLPQPTNDLATNDEDPDVVAEDGSETDPNLPMNAPETGNAGELGTPLPETMPTMPAPTADPVESRTAPPPQS